MLAPSNCLVLCNRITFPIVLDDSWNREAIHKYMKTTRDKAVYLPSNVEYLARNNGFDSGIDALRKLVDSDWVRTKYEMSFTDF